MFEVQMQFIPGNDSIWVSRLSDDGPVYRFNTEEEATAKAEELQVNDPTGRKYRVRPF
jgi:hypothetical protein